jgi:hypothetical protein
MVRDRGRHGEHEERHAPCQGAHDTHRVVRLAAVLNNFISTGVLVALFMTNSSLVLLRHKSPDDDPGLLERHLTFFNAMISFLSGLLLTHICTSTIGYALMCLCCLVALCTCARIKRRHHLHPPRPYNTPYGFWMMELVGAILGPLTKSRNSTWSYVDYNTIDYIRKGASYFYTTPTSKSHNCPIAFSLLSCCRLVYIVQQLVVMTAVPVKSLSRGGNKGKTSFICLSGDIRRLMLDKVKANASKGNPNASSAVITMTMLQSVVAKRPHFIELAARLDATMEIPDREDTSICDALSKEVPLTA